MTAIPDTGSFSMPDTAMRFASIVSIILVPPVPATAAFTLLALEYQHGTAFHAGVIWLVSVLFSGWLQTAYILYQKREARVTAYDVPERLQRTRPYAVSIALSLAGSAMLLFLHASIMVWGLMLCFAVNTLVVLAVNRYWKISAHLSGLTGPAMFLLPQYGAWVLCLLPLVILAGWARIRVNAHTLVQVLAGGLLGAVLTFAELLLLLQSGAMISRFTP
jgi:membrane-associated phospholipid phosphatase